MTATATKPRPQLAEHTTDETVAHETNGRTKEVATAALTAAVDAAANVVRNAADPIPPKTPAELRAAHYAEIVAESVLVEQSRCDFEEANAETKRLKKEYEGRQALFLRLTRRDPLQRTLLDARPDPNLEAANAAPVNDEWRKLPISVLGATEKKNEKLAAGHLHTLGDLQDFWTSGKTLAADVEGIGETTDAEYRDRFAEYGTDHPEVFGEAAKTDGEIDPDEPDADSEE